MSNVSKRDLHIETDAISTSNQNHIQLPLNFVVHGEIDHDDIKVYIHQNTYNAIERYSRSDVNNELGTFLLGEYSEYSNKMHVVISDYIEAKYTDATAATLTFTHETWDYVHKKHETNYPHLKILGWQHTHPGYGIFLSHYDIFIQENFFNLPFQVAYVVDPKQNLRGFFQWKSGKIEKLKGYYIYDEVGKIIAVENPALSSQVEVPVRGMSKKSMLIGSALLTVFIVLFVVMFLNTQYRLNQQSSQQSSLETFVMSQSQHVGELSNNLEIVQDTITKNQASNDKANNVDELANTIASQQLQINEQNKKIAELKSLLSSNQNTSEKQKTVVFLSYLVQSGDTLISICEKLGIDYTTNVSIIVSVNGLNDPSTIYVGQTLLLPIIKE